MLFSSLSFLFCFLPFTVAGYYLLKSGLRNYWLLAASVIFYAWGGEPEYVLVMFGVIAVNYFAGVLLTKTTTHRGMILFVCMAIDIGILCFFKYTGFLVATFNDFTGSHLGLPHISLPIGISFYIFQSMSYTIDVYRGLTPAQRNPCKFALYVALFPQLIAGPIVKYRDIASQIDSRKLSLTRFSDGLRRFAIGLGKKVLIANTMGGIADEIFRMSPSEMTTATAWTGAVAYTFQIYFDFSGYSDMAIGLGKILGFDFLENFNYPYISRSITEFWRRWHISLGSWFKEYLYIPLGGNRVSSFRHSTNLLIVFFATGLWHGAGWTFIVWGLWHGFFIVLEKRLHLCEKTASWYGATCRHCYALAVVIFGWVLFRADSLPQAWEFIKVMLGLRVNSAVIFNTEYFVTPKTILCFTIAASLSAPWRSITAKLIIRPWLYRICRDGLLIVILASSIASVAASGYNPFIYFRF